MLKQFIDDIGTLLTQPILNSDAYKASHHFVRAYGTSPPQYAYIEARKGGEYEEVMSFGWLYIVRYFMLQHITLDMIDEAEFECEAMGIPFNRKMWMHILRRYNGRLPITIKAVPGGHDRPTGLRAGDDRMYRSRVAPGLAAYVETLLLRVWFPITIDQPGRCAGGVWSNRYLVLSGDETMSEFKTIDFSARGCLVHRDGRHRRHGASGQPSGDRQHDGHPLRQARLPRHDAACLHDPGIRTLGHHIVGQGDQGPRGLTRDGEIEFYHIVLDRYGDRVNPQGGRYLVSIVNDTTYDQDEAIKAWLDPDHSSGLRARLEASICASCCGPTLVTLSPTSATFSTSPAASPATRSTPRASRCCRTMSAPFRATASTRRACSVILQRLTWLKWSIDNLVFGSGGGLMVHDVERDNAPLRHEGVGGRDRGQHAGDPEARQDGHPQGVQEGPLRGADRSRDGFCSRPTMSAMSSRPEMERVLTLSEQTADNLLRTILDEGLAGPMRPRSRMSGSGRACGGSVPAQKSATWRWRRSWALTRRIEVLEPDSEQRIRRSFMTSKPPRRTP